MDTDNLIVFDEDFPDGLLDELNSSYEQSRSSRPDADDGHTRSANSSSQWTRLVDERSSSQSDTSRKNALHFSDSAVDDRSGDTTPASSLHPGAARSKIPRTDLQQQYQQSQQHSLVSTPRIMSSRVPGETARESRGSPGGKNTRRYLLQRNQLPGSQFPFSSTASLMRQHAAMRGDPLKPPVGTATDAGIAASGKANAGNTHKTDSVQARPPDSNTRTGGRPESPLTPPGRAGSHPDGVNKSGERKAPSLQEHSPSSTAVDEPQTAKGEESALLGTGRNMLVVVLLVCVAVGMGLRFHHQDVENRKITASLENQIAELHELINSYATNQPHSEDTHMPVTETLGIHDRAESCSESHADKDASVTETASSLSTNLALFSAGAHILTGYTTPPASAWWWRWSQNFRADHNCMLRPASSECWPIQKDATVAIGLGQTANIEQVKLDFAGLREPFNFEAYNIHANGAIDRLANHASGPDFNLVGASNVTQLMLRFSGFGDLCIKRVEIIGKVI